MDRFLGDEFEDFRESFDRPSLHGLRVNTLKLPVAQAIPLFPWRCTPLLWSASGFQVDSEARPGKHPLHAAGLYYLQEPSAMAAAELLDVQPGHWVIDVAASPGGKSTHLASLLDNRGLLVANDPIRGRIKALGENLERWGARNAIITNASVSDLAATLPGQFDRVLVDAPCSGEGMFRRSPVAIREWSAEHVRGCAIRQEQLLESASRLVKPEGLLLYCTCTFAPEEDEVQIARFLNQHPDWTLRELVLPGGSPGHPEWVRDLPADRLTRTRRIWPHLAEGDGHFFALLQAPGYLPNEPGRISSQFERPTLRREIRGLWERFQSDVLPGFETSGELLQRGEIIFALPDHPASLHDVTVVRPGLPLGSVRPGRFEPAHALALAARPEAFARTHELSAEEATAYLRGETLQSSGASGWLGLATAGFPVGWGKRSGGQIKNHYPRGLRW